LYNIKNIIVDELIERAFCEGYEYAQKEFAGRKNLIREFVKTGDKTLRLNNGTNGIINRVPRDAKGNLITSSLFGGKAQYLRDITEEQKRNVLEGIRRREANGVSVSRRAKRNIDKMLENRANAIQQISKGTTNPKLIKSSF